MTSDFFDEEEKTTQHQFDSFCKKIFQFEKKNHLREITRRSMKEIPFSKLSVNEMDQLKSLDEYSIDSTFFEVLGYDIAIRSELLAEAIELLPQKNKDILLMYYFLDMNDSEISKEINIPRRTIGYHRQRTLEAIKKFLS